MSRNLKDNQDIFREYIKEICSKKTIFRILYDIMGHSYGSGHLYYFQGSAIRNFFNEDELQEVMKDITPGTEDEKFLVDVYEVYMQKTGIQDEDDKGIYSLEEKKLYLN